MTDTRDNSFRSLLIAALAGDAGTVLAALIGYWVIATLPILISIPAYLLLGGDNPGAFAQSRLSSLVPMVLTLLAPSVAFLVAPVFVSGKRA